MKIIICRTEGKITTYLWFNYFFLIPKQSCIKGKWMWIRGWLCGWAELSKNPPPRSYPCFAHLIICPNTVSRSLNSLSECKFCNYFLGKRNKCFINTALSSKFFFINFFSLLTQKNEEKEETLVHLLCWAQKCFLVKKYRIVQITFY